MTARTAAAARYTLRSDEHEAEAFEGATLAEVIEAVCVDGDEGNDPEFAAEVRALAIGGRIDGGGGAAPTFSVERIADAVEGA